jgi:transposase-like protein
VEEEEEGWREVVGMWIDRNEGEVVRMRIERKEGERY